MTKCPVEIKKKSLINYLGKLPVGVLVDGDRLKRFKLKPYTTEHDFYLQDFFGEEDGEVDFLYLCSDFLPRIIDSIEGYTIAELSVKSQMSPSRFIKQMYLADILSILLNIKAANGGLDVAFGGYCPACGKENKDRPELGLAHSLEGIEISHYESSPVGDFKIIDLENPISYENTIIKSISLNPITLEQFCSVMDEQPAILQIYNILLQGNLSEEQFVNLSSLGDRNRLFEASAEITALGPEMEVPVDMKCNFCRHKWQNLLTMESMIDFFRNMLKPPEVSYLHDVIFFLTFGEQAPCKSISEAKQIPVNERNALVQKLSDAYEKQKEEMDKASKKSSGKGSTTKTTY